MRQYCVFLFAGLLALAFIQSTVKANYGNAPEECCFKFYERRIPVAKISFYIETRVDCLKPGVIFMTKKGLAVCVSPKLSWVNRTMQQIDYLNM